MTLKYHAKFEKKTDLRFGNWHEQFGKFLSKHLEVLKFVLYQSREEYKLKSTEELCVMTRKNDEKLEGKLTCRFKIDIKDLMNFD